MTSYYVIYILFNFRGNDYLIGMTWNDVIVQLYWNDVIVVFKMLYNTTTTASCIANTDYYHI